MKLVVIGLKRPIYTFCPFRLESNDVGLGRLDEVIPNNAPICILRLSRVAVAQVLSAYSQSRPRLVGPRTLGSQI